MNTEAQPSRQFRTDIQALRGFAVLIVLLFHAKISFFSAGYLGVDVFFVISGFLITRLIKDGIERGSFSFSEFYFRRAKRLLPAAYVTFLVTALLAPFFLGDLELKDFQAQMVGAVTFTANIFLWQQSGYFEGAADLKPLLHVWSLAIEEQYYFLLPATLAFVPRRFWLRGAVLVLMISLGLTIVFSKSVDASFFLLPTRAWELTTGSIGALLLMGDRFNRLLKIVFWPSLLLVLALPAMPLGGPHPGQDALLICLATLVIILRKHPLLFRGAAMQGLGKIGDISYSLYLVHWPLFAFYNNIWVGEPDDQPIEMRVGLIALSLLLAYLLNRFVEEPVRRADIKRTTGMLVRTIATSLGLVVATTGITHAFDSSKDYAYIRRINYGFGEACDFSDDSFEPIQECRNSDKPEILFWGDSYAMHLVPGVLGVKDGAPPIIQATRSACSPLLGIAVVREEGYDRKWAESCINFNESVIAYLKNAESVKIVVLSSPFNVFVNTNERLLKRDELDGTYHLVDAQATIAIEGIKKTADAVRALGKRLVIIAPPPSLSTDFLDVARCTERLDRGLPTMGVAEECSINVDVYHNRKRKVLEFLGVLPEKAGVEVIDFDSYLCDSALCRTFIDGTFIYRDGGHLSHEGSVFLANAMSLIKRINTQAK